MAAEYYTQLVKGNDPNGHLSKERPCHALFFFTILVEKSIMPIDTALFIEGDVEPIVRVRNLFKSVGKMYGLEDPDPMTHYWIEVNNQRKALGLERIPDKYQLGNPLLSGGASTATIILPDGKELH